LPVSRKSQGSAGARGRVRRSSILRHQYSYITPIRISKDMQLHLFSAVYRFRKEHVEITGEVL
jgi:hypothetical protein